MNREFTLTETDLFNLYKRKICTHNLDPVFEAISRYLNIDLSKSNNNENIPTGIVLIVHSPLEITKKGNKLFVNYVIVSLFIEPNVQLSSSFLYSV